MRTIFPAFAVIAFAACSQDAPVEEAPPVALEAGIWTGGERDALCVSADGSAAFIQYGEGNANCMAQGSIEGDGEALSFIPRGDEQCSIPLQREGDVITFGTAPESCAYYCGGDASLKAEGLRRSEGAPGDLKDVAGDSLC